MALDEALSPFIICPKSPAKFAEEMAAVGVSPDGASIMLPKADSFAVKVPNLSAPQAIILKEQMLSLGGDAAQSREVITDSSATSDVILIGSRAQYARLIESLKRQQFGLRRLAAELERLIRTREQRPERLKARSKNLDLTEHTAIMGVLNVTPDSFSDGGLFLDPEKAAERAVQMEEEGAEIIDIGAESTRPGASPVTAKEELNRLLPVLRRIAPSVTAIISVDTYKSEVAKVVLEEGADLINDIGGLRFDERLASVVAEHDAAIVLMHIQGRPRTMQDSPHYNDLLGEIYSSLATSCRRALDAGINPASIVVDPGIGFGKLLEHNLRILNYLETFLGLGMPLLVGTSRKSFIGHILDAPVSDRYEGTAASVALAIARGAQIVRVHDVAGMRKVCAVADAIVRA